MTKDYDIYITNEEQVDYQNEIFEETYLLSDMEMENDNYTYTNFTIQSIIQDYLSKVYRTSLTSKFSGLLNEPNNQNNLTDDILNEKQKHQYNLLTKKLNNNINNEINFLIEEGIDLPNNSVKDFAHNAIYFLAFQSIYPDKLTTTSEGGICLIFSNEFDKLYLELYNEGDIGYIIEDKNKNLLENEDLYSLDEIINLLKRFYF